MLTFVKRIHSVLYLYSVVVVVALRIWLDYWHQFWGHFSPSISEIKLRWSVLTARVLPLEPSYQHRTTKFGSRDIISPQGHHFIILSGEMNQ